MQCVGRPAGCTLRRTVQTAIASAVVLRTADARELELIKLPHVQAVIFIPAEMPAWLAPFGAAVARGALQVPRTILDGVTADDIESWIDANVRTADIDPQVLQAVRADILSLVAREIDMTGARRLIFRIFTDVPSRHCGFHVDTVPPAAPSHGLLRVYNGNGTAYVDPDNVISMRDFYKYLSRRERVIRTPDPDAIVALDEARAFLRRPEEVHIAPAGSIVAFKHLDVRLHWSDHPRELAWIHCSPMEGDARFVVNVMASRSGSS